MPRRFHRPLPVLIGLLVLGLASPAAASPRTVWGRYVHAVGKRQDLEVLGCYSTDLRERLKSDEATLQRHMNEVFSLLIADYSHRVVDQKGRDGRTILSIGFREKKRGAEEFLQEIECMMENGEWLISKPPKIPKALDGLKLTLSGISRGQWIGFGCALLLLLVLIKKLVTHE
jgi:hypothetical protein